jgi:hypothetical protein
MIKKLLVTAIAAGALSVPLAGVAWAAPPNDPGQPGDPGANGQGPAGFGGPPGTVFRGVAKGPGSVPDALRGVSTFRTPGQIVNDLKPENRGGRADR